MKRQSLRFHEFDVMSYAREHGITEKEVRECCKCAAKGYDPKEWRMMYELHVLGCLESLVIKKFGWDYFMKEVNRVGREVRSRSMERRRNSQRKE